MVDKVLCPQLSVSYGDIMKFCICFCWFLIMAEALYFLLFKCGLLGTETVDHYLSGASNFDHFPPILNKLLLQA